MSSLFSALRAVLFDLDGTLIETHIDFAAMTAEMQTLARAADVPASVTDGKDILGLVEAAAAHVQKQGGDGAALSRVAFARLEEREVVGCAHPELLPGTERLLASLAERGIKIGIVTRNCRRVSVPLLARFALPYDLLLTRDDVARTKPDPAHLWAALTALGISPGDSGMVGDHWMDIKAGQKAGCTVTLGILGANSPDWFAPCPPTALVRDPAAAFPLFL